MPLALDLLFLISAIASLVAIPLTLWRRAERHRDLVYEVTDSVALASVVPATTEHKLTILFERPGETAIPVVGAHLHFVRLANIGTEPIRREDLNTTDPLRVEVEHSRVLDIALAQTTRDVTRLSVGFPIGLIEFDFLDAGDGCLIRVLTEGPEAVTNVLGTVIGVPAGARRISSTTGGTELSNTGCFAILLMYIAATSASTWASLRYFDDGWQWLAILGFAFSNFWCVLLVAVVVLIVSSSRSRWPKSITFPDWFVGQTSSERMRRTGRRPP